MVREFKSRRPHQKTFSDHGDFGGLCREDQDILRFSGRGFRQLKLFSASLAVRTRKWHSQLFFKVQIIGMIQREDPAD
jgi:hypothetical protein